MPCDDCSRAERCPPCAQECPHEAWETGPSGLPMKCADCGHRFTMGEVAARLGRKPEPFDYVLPSTVPDEDEPTDDEGAPDWHELYQCSDEDACPIHGRSQKPAPPVRRPPYAVAYSVGGTPYEVLLPGDAQALAEGGVLKIIHTEAVNGILRVMPIMAKEGD